MEKLYSIMKSLRNLITFLVPLKDGCCLIITFIIYAPYLTKERISKFIDINVIQEALAKKIKMLSTFIVLHYFWYIFKEHFLAFHECREV